MKNDVFMLHLLLSLLGVCERVVKLGIKKAFSRTEALKTAKMEVKIEVPLLFKVALLRPQWWRLSTALFPAFT